MRQAFPFVGLGLLALMQSAQAADVAVNPGAMKLLIAPQSDSRIPADGRSRVTIGGQVLDGAGKPVLDQLTVTLTSTGGQFIGADQDVDRPGFQALVVNGEYSVELQSGTEAKSVTVRGAIDRPNPEKGPKLPAPAFILPDSAVEGYTQVEFITNLRRPLVSGSLSFRLGGQASNFNGSFRDFLNPDLSGTSLEFDGRLFATGKVGDWLVTGAWNNQSPLNETCNGTTQLFRPDQFCDQTYPTYGDSSKVEFLTPSIDSVYFKIERTSPFANAGSDYAMWGDYTSREFAQDGQLYTATDRNLHGLKANYNFGDLQATFMYGNNLEGFQRDTIAPNGTSGYYFLSRRLVLGGSENIFIETEELNRPGTVVERVNLRRGRDYDIEYDRGAVIFRRPVLATEFDLFGNTLVRRIVATYQYDGVNNDGTSLYGGRLQYNLNRSVDRRSWIGASYLQEDRGDRDFKLYGVDGIFRFGKSGSLFVEYAQSSNVSPFLGDVEGSAYRIEANTKLGEGLAVRGYYRSVDTGFANNATTSFTPGQTRYGAELAAAITPTTQVQTRFDRETNFGIAPAQRLGFDALFNPGVEAPPGAPVDNSLTTFSAGIQQKLGAAGLSLDWVQRSREDRAANRLTEDSQQLVSRFNMPLTPSLLFRAQNELSLSNNSDPLFPSRTTLGLDWKAYPGVTLRLAQQWLGGGNFGARSITSLDSLVDYNLGENTTVTSRYSILSGVSGLTSQGALGLQHRWKVSPGLRINLGYERLFGDVNTYTAAGQQYSQPYAVGQSASSLALSGGNSYSVGFDYTDNPGFKVNGRYERRNATSGNNTLWSLSAAGKITPAVTALARFQQANAANQSIRGLGDTSNLKVGLAYRDPNDDRFNMLFRYEYRQNPDVSTRSLLFGEGTGSKVHLGAVEALYAPNFRWEFYGKFGLRSTKSTLGRESIGSNLITLGQLRTTYRLGYAWDLGGEVRWINQSNSGANEIAYLLELGYYLTPNLRVAAGYSLGRTDDVDFEGSRSRGGPYLGFTVKLNDLFGWGVQRVAPKQQKESVVKNPAEKPVIQGPVPLAVSGEAVK
jgi:hypothetical protein